MTSISRPGALDLLLIALTALIMASSFSAVKLALVDLGPVWVATMRVVIGFVVLLPFGIIRGIELPADFSTWFILVAIAALNIAIPFALISWGMKSVDSGISALLMGTTPFSAMILGHFITADEKINIYKIIAVILGLSGILIIVGPNVVSGLGSTAFLAQIAIVAASSCYVMSGFLMRGINMKLISFTILALGFGAAMLLILALLLEGVPQTMPGKTTLFSLLWLGLLPTGFGYVLRFYLVKRVGVGIFAMGMNTVPIFGVIFGAVLLGEQITVTTLIALALVVCGLLIARLGAPKMAVAVEQ